MARKFFVLVLILKFLFNVFVYADEGMWIPLLLEKYNFEDMKAKGFKLTAEDIYSVNKTSMKDAIVIFGRGCTGEMISEKGLLITNHHCGYGQIQRHSSLENDYLTHGFWAKDMSQELPNPGLTVTFLISMEDVTEKVLQGVSDKITEAERYQIIKKNIDKITSEAVKNTHYKARVESFYNGNQYFLFINEVFEDVRLVGTPPSSIGKFGGDTDNWMWPRHTGDFALFRVYCGKDGKPAPYSKDNVPLKPRKYFPISMKGVVEGDFTMVFGYPGSTSQYIPSFAVQEIMNETDPARILIRGKKLDIINQAMESSPLTRIQYSAKAASIANGWKKWIGEIRGLKRLNAIERKINFETEFQKWADSTKTDDKNYSNILSKYKELYAQRSKYNFASIYINEAGLGCDAILLTVRLRSFENLKNADKNTVEALAKEAKSKGDGIFKDYDEQTDKKLFIEMTRLYYNNVHAEFHPAYFSMIGKFSKKHSDPIVAFADYCYSKSVFANKARFEKFVNELSPKSYSILQKDPIYVLMKDYIAVFQDKISNQIDKIDYVIDSLDRIYMKAQMEFQPNRLFFPDANFTLRVTYGQVSSYYPADAIKYNYFTTITGIMEKDNPDIYDYDVPKKLKELYINKDFGSYADKDGNLRVAFIATNHTTGGNSGSPVLNAYGELVGINFDRNWEGTMSDIMYDPEMCRNIILDIRYALFVIDKYAGAKHLIEEMDLRY